MAEKSDKDKKRSRFSLFGSRSKHKKNEPPTTEGPSDEHNDITEQPRKASVPTSDSPGVSSPLDTGHQRVSEKHPGDQTPETMSPVSPPGHIQQFPHPTDATSGNVMGKTRGDNVQEKEQGLSLASSFEPSSALELPAMISPSQASGMFSPGSVPSMAEADKQSYQREIEDLKERFPKMGKEAKDDIEKVRQAMSDNLMVKEQEHCEPLAEKEQGMVKELDRKPNESEVAIQLMAQTHQAELQEKESEYKMMSKAHESAGKELDQKLEVKQLEEKGCTTSGEVVPGEEAEQEPIQQSLVASMMDEADKIGAELKQKLEARYQQRLQEAKKKSEEKWEMTVRDIQTKVEERDKHLTLLRGTATRRGSGLSTSSSISEAGMTPEDPQVDIARLKKKLRKREGGNKSLKVQLASFERVPSEEMKIQEHSKGHSRAVFKLKQQVEALAKHKEVCEGQTERPQTLDLQTRLEKSEEDNERLKRDVTFLIEEVEHLRRQVETTEVEKLSLKEELQQCERLQKQNKDLLSEVEVHRATAQTFQEDFAQERRDRELAHSIFADKEKLYTEKLETMGAQLQLTRRELDKHKQSLSSLEAVFQTNVNQRKQELESVNAHGAKLKQELESANAHGAKLKQELESANAHGAKLKQELESANAHGAKLKQELESANAHGVKLKQELESANAHGAKLKQELESANAHGAKLKQELESANTHGAKLKQELESANTHGAKLKQELESANAHGANLHEEVLSKTQQVKQYKERVDQLKEELEAYTALQKDQVELFARKKEDQDHEIASLISELEKLRREKEDRIRHADGDLHRESSKREAFERKTALLETMNDQLKLDIREVIQQLEEQTANRLQLQQKHDDLLTQLRFEISPADVEVLQGEEHVIGRGAWGYVAKGTFRGQRVAVKCLHQAIRNPHTMRRVDREIRTMARVRHPNLVLFIAAVNEQGHPPMIVTELLDINLRTAYETGRLQCSSKLAIFRDVACALNYLHQHHEPIIHRDVSTPNVLLEALAGGHWKAKVSDFGSANLARHSMTLAEGAIVYAAPETFPQRPDVQPLPHTTWIDVYSYGVLLCEVIIEEIPEPGQLRIKTQYVRKQWMSMYNLIDSCIQWEATDRPTMAKILDNLPQPLPRMHSIS